jgi:hypothetical protein
MRVLVGPTTTATTTTTTTTSSPNCTSIVLMEALHLIMMIVSQFSSQVLFSTSVLVLVAYTIRTQHSRLE